MEIVILLTAQCWCLVGSVLLSEASSVQTSYFAGTQYHSVVVTSPFHPEKTFFSPSCEPGLATNLVSCGNISEPCVDKPETFLSFNQPTTVVSGKLATYDGCRSFVVSLQPLSGCSKAFLKAGNLTHTLLDTSKIHVGVSPLVICCEELRHLAGAGWDGTFTVTFQSVQSLLNVTLLIPVSSLRLV